MFPKMKVDSEKIESDSDLGLALGNSNHSIQRPPSNDLNTGAGANAGSRIDMAFVASDPLSELVWSPHYGLSLKCADSSLADKKGSLLWGAGSSTVALSPPQNITVARSTTDKPRDEEVITPQAASLPENNVVGTNVSTGCPTSDAGVILGCGPSHEHETGPIDNMQGTSTVVGLSVLHVTQNEDQRKTEDEPKSYLVACEPFLEDPTGRGRDLGSANHISGRSIILVSDVHPVDECRASETPVQNLESSGRRAVEQLEQTAENDVQTPITENDWGAVSKTVESECAHESKNSYQQEEEALPRNETVSSKLSPTNGKVHVNQRKGKEKALSDGYGSGRSSKESDDSHESVESCNSAGVLSKGKKLWSFEEQWDVGSRRVRKKIQERPSAVSYSGQDSSFMNWISNMMKGFSRPTQDEGRVPALSMAPPSHGHQNQNPPDQNLLTFTKNQDAGFKNIGFRSIFQSLYCPKMERETTSLNANYQKGDGSKELELENMTRNINGTPVSIGGDSDNIDRQFLLPNEKFTASTHGNGASLATQPKFFPVKFTIGQENSKISSGENKHSSEMDLGEVKNRVISNCSLGKRKARNAEVIDSEQPSEVKTTSDFNYRNDPLESFWITRFCTKTSGPILNLDDNNQCIGVGLECSSDCTRLLAWNHDGFSNNHKSDAVREHSVGDPTLSLDQELQKSPTYTDAVIGSKRSRCDSDLKPSYKLSPILPSPKPKSSEAMASIFARRLDALKHIIQSDVIDNATHADTTCFFCGIKGHHLQECSEITESEIEDLLRNVNSYTGAEEFPCLCIRCFQFNHWAVACPSASSRRQLVTKVGDPLVGPSEMQHKAGAEKKLKLLTGREREFQTACDRRDLRVADHTNWRPNEKSSPEIRGSNANALKECIRASSSKNYSEEPKIIPVNRQVSDVPKGIFDSIRSLRLSRSDILKWMNSHMALSHLDGFFLRLRLGKWEEGLGGTGYHVACINGKQRENSPRNATNCLSVNVGGIKCLVESRYISNHDFVEDELMAWWSITSRDSGKIPAEEDLRLKVKEKRMLGF